VSSDNEMVVEEKAAKPKSKKKANPLSTFMVLSAVAAAGATGHFLWKYQARLEQPAAAPVATTVQPSLPEPDVAVDPNSKVLRAIQELQQARVAPAPRPEPLESTKPQQAIMGATGKSVRGGITIMGKNGVTAGVAPASAADRAGAGNYSSAYPAARPDPNAGPKVYTSRDPNLDNPSNGLEGTGRPRYYNYDLKGSYSSGTSGTYETRRTYTGSNTTSR
jgi:hypothetical protein